MKKITVFFFIGVLFLILMSSCSTLPKPRDPNDTLVAIPFTKKDFTDTYFHEVLYIYVENIDSRVETKFRVIPQQTPNNSLVFFQGLNQGSYYISRIDRYLWNNKDKKVGRFIETRGGGRHLDFDTIQNHLTITDFSIRVEETFKPGYNEDKNKRISRVFNDRVTEELHTYYLNTLKTEDNFVYWQFESDSVVIEIENLENEDKLTSIDHKQTSTEVVLEETEDNIQSTEIEEIIEVSTTINDNNQDVVVNNNQKSVNKTALIIGNGNYINFPVLSTPIDEATLLKKTLISIGFQVELLVDGSREEIIDSLYNFEETLEERGGIALFHYGGHGVQFDGMNFIIPSDADIPDERRLRTRAINVEEVVATLDAANTDTNIIILDACRNNPLPGTFRSATRGLTVIGKQPQDSIIVYSAEAGTEAEDGVFTPTLVKYLTKPGLEFSDMLRIVRREVRVLTDGRQRPGEYNQLENEIFLAGE